MAKFPDYSSLNSFPAWTPAYQPAPPPSQQPSFPAHVPTLFSKYAWQSPQPLPQQTQAPSREVARASPPKRGISIQDLLNSDAPVPTRKRKAGIEDLLNTDAPVPDLRHAAVEPSLNIQEVPTPSDVPTSSLQDDEELFPDMQDLLTPRNAPVSPLPDVSVVPSHNVQGIVAPARPSDSFDERDNPSLLEAGRNQSIHTFSWSRLSKETEGGKYTPKCCRTQYLKILSESNQPLDKEWSPGEDFFLRSAYLHWKDAWKEISALYFEGKRTPAACSARWSLLGNPVYQVFDPSDNDALVAAFRAQNLNEFDKQKLQSDMGKKYSIEVCINRLVSLLGEVKPRSVCEWSAEEDDKLRKGAIKCEKAWSTVSALYFEGERSPKDCEQRWMQHANPAIEHTPWTQQETDIVIAYLRDHPRVSVGDLYELFEGKRTPPLLNQKVRQIKRGQTSAAPTKPALFQEADTPALLKALEQNQKLIDLKIFSEEFLQGKYKHNLSALKSKTLELLSNMLPPSNEDWTEEEDARLKRGVQKYPDLWETISALCFRGSRSHDTCKLRWMNHVNPDLRDDSFSENEINTITDYFHKHKYTYQAASYLYSELKGTRALSTITKKIKELRPTLPHKEYKINSLREFKEEDIKPLENFIGLRSVRDIDWKSRPAVLKKYNIEVIKKKLSVLRKQKEAESSLSDPQDLPPEPPIKRKAVLREPSDPTRQARLAEVAEKVYGNTLTLEECQKHYSRKRITWLPKEDERLKQTILSSSYPNGIVWTGIAKDAFLGFRKGYECRARFAQWMEQVRASSYKWSSAETDRLVQAVATLGLNWPRISLEHFSGTRGADACSMKYKNIFKATEVQSHNEEKIPEEDPKSDSDTSQTLKNEEF